ncbi:hypothetical protein FB567DRAFT_633532 [Paraphoma chrysanthemicola]|uniref:Uncharacterized protein n=1 Tax=Paraphoma chrysanthemicola TaxID=798071 RepID=A0A8K0QUE4_9PLEO|nr:hypothetical protein FB567DRAFT_633532 [Paraphoma chrysanthemicola]
MPTGSYTRINPRSSILTARQRSRWVYALRLRTLITSILTFALLTTFILFTYIYTTSATPTRLQFLNSADNTRVPDWRILKTTIIYPPSSSVYDEVLRHHGAYDKRFGYTTTVLEKPVIKGAGNAVYWLQHLINVELMKPVEEQAEWLLYFDPTTIMSLIHPGTPLNAYLPPRNHTYGILKDLSVIAFKPDVTTLSPAPLFLRVSTLTLRILTLALAGIHNSTLSEPGTDVFASSLRSVLQMEAYKNAVLYQPYKWYHDYRQAVFQLHWGINEVDRLLRVSETLKLLETGDLQDWSADVSFEEQMGEWWELVVEVRQVLGEARERGEYGEEVAWFVLQKVGDVLLPQATAEFGGDIRKDVFEEVAREVLFPNSIEPIP